MCSLLERIEMVAEDGSQAGFYVGGSLSTANRAAMNKEPIEYQEVNSAGEFFDD